MTIPNMRQMARDCVARAKHLFADLDKSSAHRYGHPTPFNLTHSRPAPKMSDNSRLVWLNHKKF
jgi:hypothetical protein